MLFGQNFLCGDFWRVILAAFFMCLRLVQEDRDPVDELSGDDFSLNKGFQPHFVEQQRSVVDSECACELTWSNPWNLKL